MSVIADAVRDVIDWVAGAAEDVVDFVFDEIVAPVLSWVGDFVVGFFENPYVAVAKIVAMVYAPWTIPLIDGAATAMDGGDLGDVLKTIAISYATQKIGGELGEHIGPFVSEVIGEALSEGVKELVVSAISQGTVAATTAIIYGEDPLEAFVRGGITAAVSAGLGEIGERMGWEMEITDPDTGITTTRVIPNVVQNMVGAALTAELTGQEITPELMANALTRGLITTQLVRDYIVTNPDVSDNQISFITAAFQRTAAVALSGGTGGEAAAQLHAVISAYGMSSLHEQIENSGIGDFIGDTLDRLSGDYARVEESVAALAGFVESDQFTARREEFTEKYNALRTQWDRLNDAKEQGRIFRERLAEAEADYTESQNHGNPYQGENPAQLEELVQFYENEFLDAQTEYNRLVGLGYVDDIKRLGPLLEADNAVMQELQNNLVEAQGDLNRTADRLEGELTSVYASTEQFLVHAMDPGFNAEEYALLNNLPEGVDPYTHFLAEGQHDNVYTNRDQYEIARDQIRNTALTQLIWSGFGTGENSLARNLRSSDINALLTIVDDAGYTTPQQLQELANDPALQEVVFNQWVEVIATDPSNTYQTGRVLSEDDIAILDQMGVQYVGILFAGVPATATEALILEQFMRGRNLPDGVVPLGDGVTASDVVSGAAVLTYTTSTDPDTGETTTSAEYVYPEEMYRWDPQAGWVIGRLVQNTDGRAIGYEWTDRNGNTDTHSQGDHLLVDFGGVGGIYANAETLDTYMQIHITRGAIQEGTTWDEVQEGLGWSDSLINLAQNVFEWTETHDTEVDFGAFSFDAQNFLANAMKAGGGILDAYNGMATLVGIAPDTTALGQFAQQLQDVGAANNTEEYKEELAELEAIMNAPLTPLVDEDNNFIGTWYERAFDRVRNIAGAIIEHPSAFISEYMGVEALQELVPLAIGGLATLGARGAAMAVGRTLSTRMAAGVGLTAAATSDIAESYGGTASETYDRALTVALDSINPDTGQLFTQEEAKSYAMILAVQTGTVAALLTAASMGAGGMALERAVLGDKGVATGFLAQGIDELANRMAQGGTIMVREGVTEAIEEGLATLYRESHLQLIDPSINVAGEAAGAAFMGFLIGGPIAGGAYGVSQVGDMYSNFVSAVDPTVRAAIVKVRDAFTTFSTPTDAQIAAEMGYEQYLEMQRAEATQEINDRLDDLGVASDSIVRINVLSQVNPDYVNQAEAITAFINANPDYNPTEAEINSYVQTSGQSELDDDVDRHVDDRYVDEQEVRQFFADQGYTPTDEEVQTYIGQGPAGHEADVFNQLELEFGPGYTSEGEVRAMFEAQGYTPTDEEVQAYIGQGDNESGVVGYADPRATTEAEVRAMFEAQGYTPTDEELQTYIGQGGSEFESDISDQLELEFDPRATTEAEARQFFADQGYTPTDEEVQTYIGQGGSEFESEQQEMAFTYADPRATTEAEARQFFADLGYTPTDEEVQTYIGQGGNDFEAEQDSEIGDYVGPRQVTETEVRQFFADQGHTPTDEEVQTYVGQGGNDFESGIFNQLELDFGSTDDTVTGGAGVTLDGINEIVTAAISGLENLSEDDVSTIVSEIVGQPATDNSPATGLYAAIDAGVTLDGVNEIVAAAISGVENLNEDDVSTIVSEIVGQPATDNSPATGLYAAIGDTYTTLTSDIGTIRDDIGAISDIVGKPATEVTQADIDFVIDVIAGQQVIDENQQDLLAQYDVTGDQQITIDDQILLEQLLAGENVLDQVADTSIYAPTGTYSIWNNVTNQMEQNQDQTMDAITEMEQNIEQNIATNIEDEALRAGGRQFLQAALQAPDAMGQQVTVKQPDPLNLRYFYDFSSIFATPQQEAMFPSPYAAGGQVEDTTDKLLNMIGDS